MWLDSKRNAAMANSQQERKKCGQSIEMDVDRDLIVRMYIDKTWVRQDVVYTISTYVCTLWSWYNLTWIGAKKTVKAIIIIKRQEKKGLICCQHQ